MLVVTGEEMQILEQETLKMLGFSSLILMENAGSRIVEFIKNKFGVLKDKKIHILVGPGNNGGDGLVVARQLLTHDAKPKVYLLGKTSQLTEENKTNLEYAKKLNIDLVQVDYGQISKLRFSLSMADIIIDCMLGTGFSGQLSAELSSVVQVIKKIAVPIIAVDVPTGVDAASGQVLGDAIRADFTINLGAYKLGCLLYPGRDYAGENVVVDLGLPLNEKGKPERYLLNEDILGHLPPRVPWGHKGTFGSLFVISGSRHYAGAALLCGQAALRSGAGTVTLAVPQGIYDRFAPSELILAPLPETELGSFSKDGYQQIHDLMHDKDTLIIGPGLSNEEETLKLVQKLLKDWEKPVVIDASALEALTDEFLENIPKSRFKKWILTPHPGEMARLIDSSATEINNNRIESAVKFAEQWGLILVLKGAPTIITNGKRTYINSTGSHGMATAGTGDVLAGLIGGLLGQGAEPLYAATMGVYAHGAASDLLGKQKQRTLIAGDCLSKLSEILS